MCFALSFSDHLHVLGRMWKKGLVFSVGPVKKNKNSENMYATGPQG